MKRSRSARLASTNRSSSRPAHELVVITGLSGSGKGSVLRSFEDLGFYCVDNLPIDLIPTFADLCAAAGSRIHRAALVVDIREGEALSQLPGIYQSLHHRGLKRSLVFLEATDDALVRRFEETRRPHPLGRNLPVREGIRLERNLLAPMRRLADAVVDTSRMNVHELRDFIQQRFGVGRRRKALLVCLVSFGYRYGIPSEANLLLDVRFLPNPNYIPVLKEKTGRDIAVRKFMDSHPETAQFVLRAAEFLRYLLPNYVREGKSYLTIGIGCTGGRHRSVAVVEQAAQMLEEEGYEVKILHRDIARAVS
jgi:UPF0042 nucleotide-binding protein